MSAPSKGGDHVGPSPVDRARPGSKHHLIVDRHGTPPAVTLTGGSRHDVYDFNKYRPVCCGSAASNR